MNLNELLNLLTRLKNVQQTTKDHPLEIGTNYFIRTVTHYYTGRLDAIVGDWLVLTNASWIADTGRFHDFLKEGKCNEYESFIDSVRIPISSIIDVTKWKHNLFEGQK